LSTLKATISRAALRQRICDSHTGRHCDGVRYAESSADALAQVWYRRPAGDRASKLAALAAVSIENRDWQSADSGPFIALRRARTACGRG